MLSRIDRANESGLKVGGDAIDWDQVRCLDSQHHEYSEGAGGPRAMIYHSKCETSDAKRPGCWTRVSSLIIIIVGPEMRRHLALEDTKQTPRIAPELRLQASDRTRYSVGLSYCGSSEV